MGTDRVTQFGALQLDRGRLWLGMPRARLWRRSIPLGSRSVAECGISLEPSGVRYFDAGIPRRRLTNWDTITSITIAIQPALPALASPPRRGSLWRRVRRLLGLAATVGVSLSSEQPVDVWGGTAGAPTRVHLVLTKKTRWERDEMRAASNWHGDLNSLEAHAAKQLPEALCRYPRLRAALSTELAIAEFLGQLTAAPDTAAIDRILDSA